MRAGQIVRRLRDFVARGERRVSVTSWSRKQARCRGRRQGSRHPRAIQVRSAVDLVIADRVQVQQVLLNLIRNAMDAMETSSTRELVISIVTVDANQVKVSVADSGSGIAHEISEQLFQPFVTTKRQGMGVGLSISRTIIEAHGGRLWAEPNPTGGTIFNFTLEVVSAGDIDDAA